MLILLNSVVFSVSYNVYKHFDYTDPRGLDDSRSYLRMSLFAYAETSDVHHYRVIVPTAAGLLSRYIVKPLFADFASEFFKAERLSFWLINSLLVSLCAYIVFITLCEHYGFNFSISVITAIVFVTSRHVILITATPLVDSLLLLSIMLLWLALKSGRYSVFLISVVIGPWAKESYIFMVPIILIYCKKGIVKTIVPLLLSGMIVLGGRYLVDKLSGLDQIENIAASFRHLSNLASSLRLLLTLKGLFDVFTLLGAFWCLVFLFPFYRGKLKGPEVYIWLFLPLGLIQMLLKDHACRKP